MILLLHLPWRVVVAYQEQEVVRLLPALSRIAAVGHFPVAAWHEQAARLQMNQPLAWQLVAPALIVVEAAALTFDPVPLVILVEGGHLRQRLERVFVEWWPP